MSSSKSDLEQVKSESEITNSSNNTQGSSVPEIQFRPQLTPETSSSLSQVDEGFRSKHPLFDAPELIVDRDEMNPPDKLSSDDEIDSNENEINLENHQKSPDMSNNNAKEHHQTNLPNPPAPVYSEGDSTGPTEVPMWKQFVLPQTPDPDDTEIDRSIQEQFSIAKLLQQIRSA